MARRVGGFFDLELPMASTFTEHGIVRRSITGLIIMGAMVVTAGVLCLALAYFTTLAVLVVAGVLLLVGGVIQIVYSIAHRQQRSPVGGLFLGVLYGVTGFLLFSRPALSAVAVTAVLAAFFLVGGLARLLGAVVVRHPSWGWQALSGLASVALAIVVFVNWPLASAWLLGTIVGIDLIFAGAALIGTAAGLREIAAPIERMAAAREREARPGREVPPESRPPLS